MKLYYIPGACPLVAQICMEWMNQPYELQLLDRAEMKSPEYLALNPVGSVPTLVDGDLVITQCGAIAEYLNELHPEAGLHGQTPVERMEVRRWFNFLNADTHRTFAMIFGAQNYSEDPDIQQLLIDKSSERLTFLFGIVNKQLEGKDYLTGKRSIADPYLFVLLLWAKMKQVNLDGLDNLKRFSEKLGADAGVQAALKKQGLA